MARAKLGYRGLMTSPAVASDPADDLPPEWGELLDAVAASFPVRERHGPYLVLEWPATSVADAQTVQVQCIRLYGLVRVILVADICTSDRASAAEALALGARLILGGVIVRRGFVAIRHLFTEQRVTRGDVFEAIPFLRDRAIEARKSLLRWQPTSGATTSLFGLGDV